MGAGIRRREFLSGLCAAGTAGVGGCIRLKTDRDRKLSGSQFGAPSVVSDHHLATEAGMEILADGGTAADAAVTVASVLSVVQPWFSSVLGGGTWALYYDAELDEVTSLDGVGPVGSDATLEDYKPKGNVAGMHQAVVPGAWDGWMLWLDRYGNKDLGRLLEPAVDIAREGYPVSSEMAYWLRTLSASIDKRPYASAVYKPDGELLGEGELAYQRDMADTFESLVGAFEEARNEGRSEAFQAARDYFYRGPIKQEIINFSEDNDGYLTLRDFEGFEAEIVDPISIEYADEYRLYQNPPNSQGITMLLILNILNKYDFSEMEPDDPEAIHLQVEATKIAFADRYHHVGDPDRVDVPVQELLDEDYAAGQADRIEMDEVMEWPIESGLSGSDFDDADHTTTFHVVDEYGNAAAVTTSLGAEFLVIGDTGIHINNRMRMVSVEEDTPNRLTPSYKVRHTSNPYMAFRDGRPYIVGGNTGVDTQPQGQAQEFLNVVEFGMSAQEAVASPRFVSTSFPAGTFPHTVGGTLQMESEFPDDTITELLKMGHEVTLDSGIFGSANMVVIGDDEATTEIGAEPRVSTSEGAKGYTR